MQPWLTIIDKEKFLHLPRGLLVIGWPVNAVSRRSSSRFLGELQPAACRVHTSMDGVHYAGSEASET